MNLRHTVLEARGFWRWLLELLGLVAIVMPWRRVYILPEWIGNPIIRRHELVHIEQIDRDGAVRFSVKYLWWLLRYGYSQNPYELEAYARDGHDDIG